MFLLSERPLLVHCENTLDQMPGKKNNNNPEKEEGCSLVFQFAVSLCCYAAQKKADQ